MKHLDKFTKKKNNYWWFYAGKYCARNEEGEKMRNEYQDLYLPTFFNEKRFAKPLQIVNKTSGSRRTRFQNE